jgi:hypothetical protein
MSNSAEYWYWQDVYGAADEVDWLIEVYGNVSYSELEEIAEYYDVCIEHLMYECDLI